eukprot:Ihof_evm4s627 gene=Ihof_evmTU4s627
MLRTKGLTRVLAGKSNAEFTVTHSLPSLGTTIAWGGTTEGTITTNTRIDNAVTKDLSLEFNGIFSYLTGQMIGQLKGDLKVSTNVRLASVVGLSPTPSVTFSATSSYENLILGYESTYQVEKNQMGLGLMAIGYQSRDFSVFT